MKVIRYVLLVILVPLFVNAGDVYLGTDIGFRSGLSFQLNGTATNIAAGFPLQLRFAAAYTSLDPGTPLAARRVFINNNTNGTPEKKGWMWDLRFDLLYKVKWFSLKDAYFYAGPRYSWFTARFDFVGGNEDFDIYSDQWGFGVGLESRMKIGKKVQLVLNGGLDYFFTDFLHGHDTSYYSDGEIINGREDYTYDDADDAVNQPKMVPKISIGINYLLQ
jgi:hypothetical protein